MTPPVNITEVGPEEWEQLDYPGGHFYGRRPFLYHAPTNTAYVGPQGSHHGSYEQILRSKLGDRDWDNYHDGAFGTEGNGAYIKWWRTQNDTHKYNHVLDAIKNHFNLSMETTPAEDTWAKWGHLSFKEHDWHPHPQEGEEDPDKAWETPQIQEHDFEVDKPYEMQRRPWIWDRATNIVHVGPHGAFHRAVVDRAKIPYENTGGLFYEDGLDQPPTRVRGFDVVPEEITAAIEDNYGIANDRSEWGRFGTVTSQQHDLKWEPGQYGKGWVMDDGSVMTWPIDPETRLPFHMDMRDRMREMGREPMILRDDHGWNRGNGSFQIRDDGVIHRGGQPLEEKLVPHILKADPRLKDIPYLYDPQSDR